MPNWKEVLEEIAVTEPAGQQSPFDIVRMQYLERLSAKTERNVIAYYSGWLQYPTVFDTSINDEDRNGFMLCCHGIDPTKGLDLILHTPGGNIYATASIIHYLREIFGDNIRAIVPQIAMSAGTIIATSCKSIIMGKHSNLGPVDPQMNGIPAQAVKAQFEQARKDIQKDSRTIPIWQPMFSQLGVSFLTECNWAIEATKELVIDSLKRNMLKNDPDIENKAKSIAKELSDLTKNKSHERHFHADDCASIGLTIEKLEDDQILQDLVLTVHHCYMYALANLPLSKIIENQNGNVIAKQVKQG